MRTLSALALALMVAPAAAVAATPSPLPVVTVSAPNARLRLEVARTPAEQARGLMDRTNLPAHSGMLFVFDDDGPVEFWMKDTLLPLDMIFVGADGTVRKVYARVPVVAASLPDDRIPREPGQAKYVIELNAGEAARDGIAPKTRLAIPLPRA